MPTDFQLPDLGEGIDEADVLKVYVSPGDVLAIDDPVVEIETEKATIDVPSSFAGAVTAVHVKEGETIAPGQLLITLDQSAAPASAPETTAAPEPQPEPQPAPAAASTQPASAAAPLQPAPIVQPASIPPEAEPVAAVPEAAPTVVGEPEDVTQRPAFASPSVRKFAREIGVDIYSVAGSGPGGRTSEDDVKRHAREDAAKPAPAAETAALAAPPLPDFSRWGPIEREPLSRFRRTVARNMTLSWTHIPHVTVHHTADVTELEAMRQRYKARAVEAGGTLTVTAILLKIVASALRAHPRLNASLDLEREELVLKRYYHLGVAVDTERGLVVPVVRDVDRKNIIQLAVELTQISQKARDGDLSLDDMRGATFTLTNLGGLGTGHFTPIINHPEIAILGIGRAERTHVEVDGEFETQLRMPLSLSFDHRVIDGADAARFMTWIANAIDQPLMLALEG